MSESSPAALKGTVRRVKGGLEAERAERVKCKQEDMERERRNFEAMQVRFHHQMQPAAMHTLSPLSGCYRRI